MLGHWQRAGRVKKGRKDTGEALSFLRKITSDKIAMRWGKNCYKRKEKARGSLEVQVVFTHREGASHSMCHVGKTQEQARERVKRERATSVDSQMDGLSLSR